MKLYLKFLVLIFSGIVTISLLSGIFQVRRETVLFKNEIKHDADILGHILGKNIVDTWHKNGMEGVQQLIHEANGLDSMVRIRWVWFDTGPGAAVSPDTGAISDGDVSGPAETVDEGGETRLSFYFRVPLPEKRPGGLEISESLSGLKQYTKKTVIHVFVFMLTLIFAVGVILTLSSSRLLKRPLESIMQRIREIQSGHLDGNIVLLRRDEMGELAEAINHMSSQLAANQKRIRQEMQARIETLEQLRHADRLRSVGRLASGVAHELGTPLNVISGRASLIASDKAATAEIIENTRTIRGQCQRMTLIIRQLLDFARKNAVRKGPCDLNTLVTQTTALLKPLALKQRVTFDFNAPDGPSPVRADPDQIEHVLTNLFTNAIQAMPSGGRVHVGIEAVSAKPPEGPGGQEEPCYELRVKDEGAGISPDDLPHIFEPFFTTKNTGDGTGLGLSIVYGIIHEHGGWIKAASEKGHGSTFSVYLPREKKS